MSPDDYRTFSLVHNRRIAIQVKERLQQLGLEEVPMTLFAKGANWGLEEIVDSTVYDVLGLDWVHEPMVARRRVGAKVALQGNLDPNVLYGGREAIEREVRKMADGFKVEGASVGWIANLGHGITPGVDPDDLKWFFECVHTYSRST